MENLVLSEAAKAEEYRGRGPAGTGPELVAQALYQQVSTTVAINKRFFMQLRYFNEGENTGHLLAVIARAQQGWSHIEAIQNLEGETVTGQIQIYAAFTLFPGPIHLQGTSHKGRARSLLRLLYPPMSLQTGF